MERTQIGGSYYNESYYTASRADLGATSTYMIQSSNPGDVGARGKAVKLAIKNRLILYFLALAREQRYHGTAEL